MTLKKRHRIDIVVGKYLFDCGLVANYSCSTRILLNIRPAEAVQRIKFKNISCDSLYLC